MHRLVSDLSRGDPDLGGYVRFRPASSRAQSRAPITEPATHSDATTSGQETLPSQCFAAVTVHATGPHEKPHMS